MSLFFRFLLIMTADYQRVNLPIFAKSDLVIHYPIYFLKIRELISVMMLCLRLSALLNTTRPDSIQPNLLEFNKTILFALLISIISTSLSRSAIQGDIDSRDKIFFFRSCNFSCLFKRTNNTYK